MSMIVRVITEGATERDVGKVLIEKCILDKSLKPILGFNTDDRETQTEFKCPECGVRLNLREKVEAKSKHEGYDYALGSLLFRERRGGLLDFLVKGPTPSRVLLIFDQEKLGTPMNRAKDVAAHFRGYGQRNKEVFWENFEFEPVAEHSNLFSHFSEKLSLMLHVSDATGCGENRDFDGYILQLLQGPSKENIVNGIIKNDQLTKTLIRKAEEEIPALMISNGFPITSSKSWLYTYIAAFQRKKSHVYFAEEVVRNSPEEDLRKVFAPLIAAWDALKSRSVK